MPNPTPHGYIPDTWGPSDPYEHTDLANNFDAIDANLWRLDQERAMLGELRLWYRFPGNNTVTLAMWQAAGWQACDGRQIGTNGLGLATTTAMPDFRYRTAIGSASPDGGGSPTQAYPGDGTAGTVGDGASHAPGIGGQQGSNGPITVPNHYHWHSHIHEFGAAGFSTTYQTSDAKSESDFYSGAPSGTGTTFATARHEHLIDAYTSLPRDPTNANMNRLNPPGSDPSLNANQGTSLQKKPTGGSSDQPTGGSEGDSLTLSQTPASFGALWLMKVAYVATPSWSPPL